MDESQRKSVFDYVFSKADAIGYMGFDSAESKKFQDQLEADDELMRLAGERLQRKYIKDTILNRYSKLRRYIDTGDVLEAIDGIAAEDIVGTKDELENGLFKIVHGDLEIPCTSASFSEWQTVLKRFGAIENDGLRFAFITCGGIKKPAAEIEEVKKILRSYGVIPFIVKPNDVKANIQNFLGSLQKATKSNADVVLYEIVDRFIEDAERANFRIKKADVHRFVSSLLSKRFLIATGLAGSGKTKLAQIFSAWITPTFMSSDPFAPGQKVESDRTTYFVKASGPEFVEFWNGEDPQTATRVGLPRKMIEEWADYITSNRLSSSTPARDIREAVKTGSRYSDQLHSFETHLKAAAFTLIESRGSLKKAKCYEIVSVGADWTGSENILGYPNGLDSSVYVSKPSLDLILRAQLNPHLPHFLILDEMNLSHVERYFADILSVIESGEKIHLHKDSERKADGVLVPQDLSLPPNLFIIGTVNVDETTYMFSPKVLDRANVIEFRMNQSDLAAFLEAPLKPDVSMMSGGGEGFGVNFTASSSGEFSSFIEPLKSRYELEMMLFFRVLSTNGAEYGYRVAHEAARFVQAYKELGGHGETDLSWFNDAFDFVVAQKFLPKLHGSRAKLGPLLKKLWFLCATDQERSGQDLLEAAEAAAKSTEKQCEPSPVIPSTAKFKVSAEKINRMWRLLNENGFASFAEA
jgi:hypothetical protein